MFFFFKQKTAYEMRISDWSSDVCSSDLTHCRHSAAGYLFDKCDKLPLVIAIARFRHAALLCRLFFAAHMRSRAAEGDIDLPFDRKSDEDRSEERRVGKEC